MAKVDALFLAVFVCDHADERHAWRETTQANDTQAVISADSVVVTWIFEGKR